MGERRRALSDLYDADIVEWPKRRAALLRQIADGERINSNELDWPHLPEEIEEVGKSEGRELHSRVRTILDHLFRLVLSPASEPKAGLVATILKQRAQLRLLLRDSPSLKAELAGVVAEELPTARKLAVLSLAEHGETPTADPATLTFGVADVITLLMPSLGAMSACRSPGPIAPALCPT